MGSIDHLKTPMLDQIGIKDLEVFIVLVRNYFFLKNYVTFEGVVSHNNLYYQHLADARYQVSF